MRTASVPEAVDPEQLYTKIQEGYERYPSPLRREGRVLRRWIRNNPETARRIENAALAAMGIAAVRGEDGWGLPGPRGFRGGFRKGMSSGLVRTLTPPEEFMMATNFSAGWTPNSIGSPAPMIGTPIGVEMLSGQDLGFDVLAWLQQHLLSTPSAFIMSVPGLGKSSLVRQILEGHIAQGHVPLIPADSKGEYVTLVEKNNGQVIRIGHGLDRINPLDAGALGSVVPVLREAIAAEQARGDKANEARIEKLHSARIRAEKEVAAAQRRMVETLVSIARQGKMEDYESSAIAVALEELYRGSAPSGASRWEEPPTPNDLMEQLAAGSPALFEVTVSADSEEYRTTMRPLLRSLHALQHGVTGDIFSGQTTTKIDVDSPAVVIDVSAIDDNDETVKAAVMMACWSSAAGAVTASKILSDAGLRTKKLFAYTLDELWATLAAAPGLTKHVDALMRLLRTLGMGVYLVTHGSKDLETLPTQDDRNRAMGFIDRAGAVICGGLPADELRLLRGKLPFTPREIEEITSWSKGVSPPRVRDAAPAAPPGRGCFMIKASKSSSPGIPFRTIISPLEEELGLHDTNAAFHDEWERINTTEAVAHV